MSGLPDGVVTFLFSDIEGSTSLVKALRDRYPQVLAEYRRLVRAAIAARGGHEVDTAGDGFFAAFSDATHAVVCARQVQRELAAHEWPAGAAVRVRIGVHTGQALLAAGGYTGVAVHRAARICAAARGGQVLISQATRDLIEDEEGQDLGFALVDVGEHQLKDLDRPVQLFQLAAAGLDPPAPPPGARRPAGLPEKLVTSLQARDAGPGAGSGPTAGAHRVPGGADQLRAAAARRQLARRTDLVRRARARAGRSRGTAAPGPAADADGGRRFR